jgi:hypothetical protein
MKANKVIPIFILTICGLVLLWSLRISPFKFEWDPVLRERNDDGILVLRTLYCFLMVAFGAGLFVARVNSKGWVKCFYIGALVMVFFKILEVFSV